MLSVSLIVAAPVPFQQAQAQSNVCSGVGLLGVLGIYIHIHSVQVQAPMLGNSATHRLSLSSLFEVVGGSCGGVQQQLCAVCVVDA